MSPLQRHRGTFVSTLASIAILVIGLTTWRAFWPMWKLHRMVQRLTSELVGPVSIERLSSNAYNTTNTRAIAANQLGELGPAAESALPKLLEVAAGRAELAPDPGDTYVSLSGSDVFLRSASVHAIGEIWGRSDQIVPVLCATMVDASGGYGHEDLFNECCTVLTQKGVTDDAFNSALASGLKSREKNIRRLAADTLIALNREAAVKALLDVRTNATGGVRRFAIIKLGELGRDAQIAVPSLIEDLEDEREFVRLNAAETLWQITGRAELSIPTLLELVRDESSYFPRELAVAALARMGPAAHSATPDLSRASENDFDLKVRYAAREALSHIVRSADAATPGK